MIFQVGNVVFQCFEKLGDVFERHASWVFWCVLKAFPLLTVNKSWVFAQHIWTLEDPYPSQKNLATNWSHGCKEHTTYDLNMSLETSKICLIFHQNATCMWWEQKKALKKMSVVTSPNCFSDFWSEFSSLSFCQ